MSLVLMGHLACGIMTRMPPLTEERRGRRLQALWVCFVVYGVALTRLGQHFGVHLSSLKLLYEVVAIVAIALGFVFYRRDVKDDLPKTVPSGFSGSPPGSQALLILLAVGLVYGVWEISRDSLAWILALPINAMWLWLTYISNLNALAERKNRLAQ